MRFYEFNDKFPYTATVYAENEEQAFNIYQSEVCDLEIENLDLVPNIIDVDIIAKEIKENALKGIVPELDDIKIYGVANWFFDVLISEEATVIFVDSALY